MASLYADKVSGDIAEDEYADLKVVFEDDKAALLKRKLAYEKELSEYDERLASHENIMCLLNKYRSIDALNHEIVNDFIDSVKVYEKDINTNQVNIEINWLF